MKFVCDLATLAEATKLIYMLHSRYKVRFIPPSPYEDCRFSHESEAEDFSLFFAIIDYWEYQLGDLFFVAFDPDTGSIADRIIPCTVEKRGYNIYDYENISDALLQKLKPLFETISDIWISSRYLKDQRYPEYESTTEFSLIEGDKDSLLHEIGYSWQQLLRVCATADSVAEISTADACRKAAADICRHYNIPNPALWQTEDWYSRSPENPEIDFACGLAGGLLLGSALSG